MVNLLLIFPRRGKAINNGTEKSVVVGSSSFHLAVLPRYLCLLLLLGLPGMAMAANFIGLSESSGLVGGRGEQIQILQVTDDDSAKFWVEDSDDSLLDLRIGSVETKALFLAAEQALAVPIPPVSNCNQRPQGLLPEYYPPRTALRIRIGDRDWSWSGNVDGLPVVWQSFLAKLHVLPSALPHSQSPTASRFLRCEQLTPNELPHLRAAELIHELTPADLATPPVIQEAIRQGTALLPTPSGVDILAGVRQPRSAPSRAYVVMADQCYFLRILTYKPTTGRTPEKETGK